MGRKPSFKCSITGCTSARDDPEVHFHAFPRSEKRYQLWLRAANNPALYELKKADVVQRCRVCRKHFEAKFMRSRIVKGSQFVLTPDAYPTLITEQEVISGTPDTAASGDPAGIPCLLRDHTYSLDPSLVTSRPQVETQRLTERDTEVYDHSSRASPMPRSEAGSADLSEEETQPLYEVAVVQDTVVYDHNSATSPMALSDARSTASDMSEEETQSWCDVSDVQGDPNVAECDACLARGRRVAPLGPERARALHALERPAARDAAGRLLVCWECRALVGKSLLFCERVRRAHEVLASRADENYHLSLSTLIAVTKIGFDYNMSSDHTDVSEEPAMSNIKFECDNQSNDAFTEPHVHELEFVSIAATDVPIERQNTRDQLLLFQEGYAEHKANILNENITNRAENTVPCEAQNYIPVAEHIPEMFDQNPDPMFEDNLEVTFEPKGLIDMPGAENLPSVTDGVVSSTYTHVTRPSKEVQMDKTEEIGTPSIVKPFTILNGVQITLKSESERLQVQEEDRKSEPYFSSLAKCETCIVGFKDDLFLEEHNDKKHKPEVGPFLCDICAVRFPVERELWAHRVRHYQAYVCSGCPFADRSFEVMRRHYRVTHEPDRDFPCRKCEQVFKTYQKLAKHREKVHTEKKKCPHCDVTLENSYYHKHLAKHRSTEQLECSVCKKKYIGRERLKAHLRSHTVEGGEAAYCVECDKQFKDKYTFWMHLKQSARHVGVDDMRYSCEECGKRFITAPSLQYHVSRVHREERVQCDQCDKSYMTAAGLRTHVRSVHKGERPVKDKTCNFCKKAFSAKVLEAHLRTHTGERPYECAICGAKFAHTGSLNTHNRLVHLKLKRNVKKRGDISTNKK